MRLVTTPMKLVEQLREVESTKQEFNQRIGFGPLWADPVYVGLSPQFPVGLLYGTVPSKDKTDP
jgi:hypothetical protein